MRKRNAKWLLTALPLLLVACVEVMDNSDSGGTTMDLIMAPDWFNYATTRDITVSVTTLDNGNKPLKNVPLEFSILEDGVAVSLGTVATDDRGRAVFTNRIPDAIDSIVIKTDYPGLVSESRMKVSTTVDMLLGGLREPAARGGRTATVAPTAGRTAAVSPFTFMGTYDAQGVPNYLEPVNDYIPQDLLDLVNNSLPERRPVPTYNPEYLADGIVSDTRLKEDADVWVTFVHEGAGYLNSLGYYTYDLDTPPKTVNDLKKLNIVLPNVSLSGSGGGLNPGNKVYLGRFPANTGIGWFLIPNGWNGKTVVPSADTKYSTDVLNAFTSAQYQQHVVLLNDKVRELLLLGFEDISRPGGDNDFNDAVFFVSANPYTAIVTENLGTAKTATGNDSDGDGIIDKNDKYPKDSDKAFDVFTPAEKVFGTVAFEDMWPDKGDYDMNDLVADYNFQITTNAANAAVEMSAAIELRALGASFQNGFGIQLPVSPDKIKSVTLSTGQPASIKTNGNGTEANQSKAVIIILDKSQDLFGSSMLVNTQEGKTYLEPKSITMQVVFTEPIKLLELGYAPYNPFIFVNGDRTLEVHLPDELPTDLANTKLLGSHADSSDPATGRYYKSGNNLPWAINLPVSFDYPFESRAINASHLMFADWAKSGGAMYKDWYKDLKGYRDPKNVYKK